MRAATRIVQPGEVFGRWTVLEARAGGVKKAACRCSCGTQRHVTISNLLNGKTRSCGCLRDELAAERGRAQATHGHTRGHATPTYESWRGMLQRCSNPKNSAWQYYGARGITVCERWADFENFLADMGERPEGKTLDRMSHDGNYEPGNCRWATYAEQTQNRRPRAV